MQNKVKGAGMDAGDGKKTLCYDCVAPSKKSGELKDDLEWQKGRGGIGPKL